MKIIVDTNIAFSAILNTNSRIARIFLQPGTRAIIKVENLSKRFIISHEQRERYTSLRDVVTRKVKKTFSFGARLYSF